MFPLVPLNTARCPTSHAPLKAFVSEIWAVGRPILFPGPYAPLNNGDTAVCVSRMTSPSSPSMYGLAVRTQKIGQRIELVVDLLLVPEGSSAEHGSTCCIYL